MTALLLLFRLLCAGAGVCALARCPMEEGLPLALLGLIAAGYPLALAGGTAWLGLLPWLLRIAGVVLLFKALVEKPVRWENFIPAVIAFGLSWLLGWL